MSAGDRTNFLCDGLKQLLELEQDDRYVFHGSGLRLQVLHPMQAFTEINGAKVPDGPPALFATQFRDYAIFMALINPETCPDGLRASASYENGQLVFSASAATLTQLSENTRGYVHVFHRTDFVQRNQTEWIRRAPAEALAVVPVTRLDFRPQISVDCTTVSG